MVKSQVMDPGLPCIQCQSIDLLFISVIQGSSYWQILVFLLASLSFIKGLLFYLFICEVEFNFVGCWELVLGLGLLLGLVNEVSGITAIFIFGSLLWALFLFSNEAHVKFLSYLPLYYSSKSNPPHISQSYISKPLFPLSTLPYLSLFQSVHQFILPSYYKDL